jgi:PKD repeat protein
MWQFGDGQTSTQVDPVHVYALPGTYMVTLTITDNNGCQASKTVPVTITQGPAAGFAASSPACQGTEVLFTDLTNAKGNAIIQWLWNFGDGNQATYGTFTPTITHTYVQSGTFIVKLKVITQNGCENIYQQAVVISPAPAANFSYQNTCQGETTQFHDLSVVSGGITNISWYWNFGEPASGINNTSTLQNPSHLYTSTSQYVVMLITYNAAGCADTMQKTINILPKPEVDFYNDPTTCVEEAIQFFTDTTVTVTGAVLAYDWDFGDGSLHSNLQNPTHTYSIATSYTVTLTITDTAGCSNAVGHGITIHEGPVSAFSHEQNCMNTATLFTDQSQAPAGGTITGWHWDFGITGVSSDTSDLQHPAFTYQLPGVYTVSLTTTTNNGCTNTKTLPVQIFRTPDADFSYSTTPCNYGTVQFQDSSSSFQSVVNSWLWEFEPYQYSTNRNPLYTYFIVDTCYSVRLIISDLNGCMDTIVKPVCIPAQFTTEIAYQSTCFGNATSFTANILTPSNDQISSIVWNFGDPASGTNNSSTILSPAHTFSGTGFFTVSMTATDKFGCQSTASTTVEVFALPSASFICTNNPFSTVVDFTSTSVIAGAAIDSYTWNFGDGTIQTLLPPNISVSHTYALAGYYTVTLTITDKNGCVSTYSEQILCSPTPQASIDMLDTVICQNYNLVITNNSTGAIDQWIWNWGDGTLPTINTSYQPTISHIYTQPGTYQLSLKIISNYNGTPIADSTGRVITVIPAPVAGFTIDKLCQGEMTQFYDASDPNGTGILQYAWNFGDLSAVDDTSNSRNSSYTYATAGEYIATLVTTNQFGCSDTIAQEFKVNGLPEALFNNSLACQGSPTFFFDHSVPNEESIIHWGWRIGDNQILGWMDGESASFVFDTLGTYHVQLTVTDGNGCIDTVSRMVTVVPRPISAFSIEENINNEQGRILLSNGSIDGTEYHWILGNGETSSEESPEVTYDQDGDYVIQLFTTNSYGCTDSIGAIYHLIFKGLYIPNAFAPAGAEQATRIWKPAGINLAYYKVEVYDRWEGLIWSSSQLDEKGSPVEGWDGSYRGSPCQSGVYVWKISAVFRDGSIWNNDDVGIHLNMPEKTSGSITLIR